jgi:hypothetical protein
LWFWDDGARDDKNWFAYQEDNPPYQDVLESKYHFDPTQTCCFEVGKFQYELDFRAMIQTNMTTKKRRQVCRRPIFISKQNFLAGIVPTTAKFHFMSEKLPLNEGWLPMDTESLHWTDLVPINKDHHYVRHVYARVAAEFHLTMPKAEYKIHRIYGIQNLEMWRKYKEQKAKMEKLFTSIKERSLFHGTTDEKTVRCICYQNFDHRMHGVHGTLYGKGAYFSATAKYSHSYTQPLAETGHRFMFFARVLVGQSVVGKPEYQRPPPIDSSRPHGALYDSCIDSAVDPKIFVVFDDYHCYPEFLIEYKSLKADPSPVAVRSQTSFSLGSGSYASMPSSLFVGSGNSGASQQQSFLSSQASPALSLGAVPPNGMPTSQSSSKLPSASAPNPTMQPKNQGCFVM